MVRIRFKRKTILITAEANTQQLWSEAVGAAQSEFRQWLRDLIKGDPTGMGLQQVAAISCWGEVVEVLRNHRGDLLSCCNTMSSLVRLSAEKCRDARSAQEARGIAQLIEFLTRWQDKLETARTRLLDLEPCSAGERTTPEKEQLTSDTEGEEAAGDGPVETTIVVPTELLAEAHAMLFPAEKMAFVAGRRFPGGAVRATAVFDVTGDSNAGHVRGCPPKMHRALIAMEETGSFLAMWAHSHPGSGPGSVLPSSIDTEQHDDWLRVYPKHLLGMIMAKDGYIHFFGDALEQDEVRVRVEGNAAEEVEDHGFKLSLPWLTAKD